MFYLACKHEGRMFAMVSEACVACMSAARALTASWTRLCCLRQMGDANDSYDIFAFDGG